MYSLWNLFTMSCPLWRVFGFVDALLKSFCLPCNLTSGSLEFSRSTSWGRKPRFCQLHWSHRSSHWSHRSSGGSNLYGKLEKKNQGFVSYFRFVIVHIYVLCTNFAFLCKCTLDIMCN